MKIVNVEDYFHPDAGYQMNVLGKYLVKMGHDVSMITAEPEKLPEYITKFFDYSNVQQKDKLYQDKYGMKIIRLPIKSFISGRCVFSWRRLKTCLLNEKPDVIFMHGNNTLTAIMLLKSSIVKRIPIVMDCHMVEMASVNRFKKVFEFVYRKFVTPTIMKYNIPVIRIQDEPYVEKCLGIPLKQSPFISVGSDVMLFRPNEKAKEKFRNEYGIPQDAFVILYAGKLDAYKGGQFLANAIKEKLDINKNVYFVIVGQCVGEYGKNVEKTFNQSTHKILRLPTQKYEDLAYIYQGSDMAVFPRQCSLSFYDVQACGLPVVFEDNEVNISRAVHDNAVTFQAGNIYDFRQKMSLVINLPDEDFRAMTFQAMDFVKKSYNYQDIARQYMDIIEQVVQRKYQ